MHMSGCAQESLRKYTVVPVVTRVLNDEDELCGYTIPRGTWVVCHLQRVHHAYKDPLEWQPERFMPGGEYDQFPEDIRPYMVRRCMGVCMGGG
jgi:cytochrome P450